MNVCKSSCQTPTFSKQYNNVSKKMLQAQMIRTNGRYAYKYSNSNTDSIHRTIISQDYDANKALIFKLSLNGYMNYYKPLAIQYKLTNVAETIVQDLTLKEKATLSCDVEKPEPAPTIPTIPLEGKTYYVVTRSVGPLTYFIFKNYGGDDIIFPTYTYTFDMSDPSNTGTSLKFSFAQGGAEISSTYMEYNTEKSLIKLTLPNDINYTQLFPYNDNEPNLFLKYNSSGFTVGSFYIRLSTFAQPIATACNPTFTAIPLPNIFFYNNKSHQLVYLTASSVLYVYDFNGPNISIADINSRSSTQYIPGRKYGLSIHQYYMYIPKAYPIAILNSTQETNIQYTGDANKAIRGVIVIGTEADDLYDFYYGTITITVTGSFQPISIYTMNYGYLHAKQSLVYAENPDPTFETNPFILPY